LQQESWFFEKAKSPCTTLAEANKLYRKRSVQSNLVLAESVKYQDGILVEIIRHKYFQGSDYVQKRLEQFENVKCDEKKHYDKAGRLISVEYSRNGEFVSCQTFDYDRRGNKINHQFFQIHDDLQCNFHSEYDRNNRVRKMYIWAINVPESTVFYKYDAKTQVSKMVLRLLKDYPECRVSFEYDGDKLIEENFIDNHGEKFLKVQYVYDSANCLIEKHTYDKGLLFSKFIMQYDENKRKTSAQMFLDEDFWQRKWYSGLSDFMM